MAFAIPLAALIVSMATLMFTALSTRTKASLTDVSRLEARVLFLEAENARLATELRDALAANIRVTRENIELMRRLLLAEPSAQGKEGG